MTEPVPVVPAIPDAITQAELAEALDGFWLFTACAGQRVHGQVADPDEVASVLLATLGRIAAERSPDEPAEAPQIAAPVTPSADTGRESAAAPEKTQPRTDPISGEALGPLVHLTRLKHDAALAAKEGRERFRLGDWDQRPEHQQDLDIAIAEAVAGAVAAGVREQYEDRITFIESLASGAKAAAEGYPEHSPAWIDMTARYEAYAKAAEVARGVTGGEGWGEP